MAARLYTYDGPFDLSLTAAPVAWGRGRWPNVDWVDGALVWVGWEEGNVAVRQVWQEVGELQIDGASEAGLDLPWLDSVLGWTRSMPVFDEPVLDRLAARMPGLRPFANGSLFEGVIGSIVGQSISVAAAATTERRLAALVHPGLEIGERVYFPSPRAPDLAQLTAAEVRETGVTWRRAEAIVTIAKMHQAGQFPNAPIEGPDPTVTRAALRSLPLVGPWTAQSALLWGLGMSDIYPSGDVALLRAARQAYGNPTITMKEMDRLSEGWRPWRSWAARLLWTDLLGPAPVANAGGDDDVAGDAVLRPSEVAHDT